MGLLVREILAWLADNWKIVALLGTWSGIALLWVRRWRAWRRKTFLEQVNFSLNYVENGRLSLRTLLEDTAQSVWLNEYGVRLVARAARRATVDQPFVSLPSDEDMAYLKRAVLNVLSEKFAEGFLAQTLGLPTAKARYVFGVTCEKYGALKTQKLRVILMRTDDLDALFDPARAADPLRLAESSHRDRMATLRKLHELHHHSQPEMRRLVGEVELALPLAAPAETSLMERFVKPITEIFAGPNN